MHLKFFTTKAALLSAAFLFGVFGCATPDPFGSTQQIIAWAAERGFVKTYIHAGKFRLAAFIRKPPAHSDTIVIYIEGDGASWITPYHPPSDPTPHKPMSLVLAAAEPSPAVVYLGRPCQYLDAELLGRCDIGYWTQRRFAPEVIAAYDAVLTQMKLQFDARQFRLVGYSGGGVIATLLAAQRDDVELLVTVAAPLSVSEWVALHDVTPLAGSRDPAELGANVRLPPSVHFVGGHDKTVPVKIVESFVHGKGGRMEIIPDFDHDCCWERDWVKLLERIPLQENTK